MYICVTIEYLQKCVTLYPSNTVGVTVGAEAAYLSGTLDAWCGPYSLCLFTLIVWLLLGIVFIIYRCCTYFSSKDHLIANYNYHTDVLNRFCADCTKQWT